MWNVAPLFLSHKHSMCKMFCIRNLRENADKYWADPRGAFVFSIYTALLLSYQLFNVMFSFEFHADTFFVYLHTFCLQHLWFAIPPMPQYTPSRNIRQPISILWRHILRQLHIERLHASICTECLCRCRPPLHPDLHFFIFSFCMGSIYKGLVNVSHVK